MHGIFRIRETQYDDTIGNESISIDDFHPPKHNERNINSLGVVF